MFLVYKWLIQFKEDSRFMNILSIKVALLAIICIFIFSPVVFSAETTAEKTDANVLARVGNEVITQTDLETALKKLPERKREKFREKTLDQLIEVKVLSNEARNAGLDKDPKTREALEKATKEILAQQFVKKIIDEKSQPSEEDMKKYYSDHKDQFVIPDGVYIQHILVKKQEDAQAILEKLKGGASFEKIAKKKYIRYELFWKKKKELIDKYYTEAKVNKIPAEKGILFKIGDETFKEEIIASILSDAPEKEKEKV